MKARIAVTVALALVVPSLAFAQHAASLNGPVRPPDPFQSLQSAPAQQQEQAVEYSDAYGTRVTIHRITSYALVPLFAAQYYIGDRLMNENDPPGWVRSAHGGVAAGIGLAYGANTVTGVWNLIESRKDPAGRTRRWLHTIVMAGAGVGMIYAAGLAEDDDDDDFGEGGEGNSEHRNAAVISMGLSTANALIMLLWKD